MPPRRPGRPRRFEEDSILEALMRAFWRGGFAHTTVAQLEVAAGVRRSSLYRTFGTKEAMYVAALQHYQGRLAEAMLGPLERGTRGVDDIVDFFGRIERGIPGVLGVQAPASGCLVINALSEFGASDLRVNREGEVLRTNFLRAMGSALDRCVKRREIRKSRVGGLAELLLLVATAINFAAHAGAGEVDRGRMAHTAIDIVRGCG